MSNCLSDDVDILVIQLQQTVDFTNSLKEKCKQAERERLSALAEIEELKSKYDQLKLQNEKKSKCEKCVILNSQLIQQRRLAKETQARLKSVASLLNFDDGAHTDQLTEARFALVSQMLEVDENSDDGDDDDDVDSNKEQSFSLLSGKPAEDELDCNILAPETLQYGVDYNDMINSKCRITIPETQVEDENCFKRTTRRKNIESQNNKHFNHKKKVDDNCSSQFMNLVQQKAEQIRAARLNRSFIKSMDVDDDAASEAILRQPKQEEILQLNTWRELADINKNINGKENKSSPENKVPLKRVSPDNRLSLKSKSFSEDRNRDTVKAVKQNIETVCISSTDSSQNSHTGQKSHRLLDENEKATSVWKLKPSNVIEADVGGSGDMKRKKKKMTQMQLSVASCNKKQDVSSLKCFNGGVASTSFTEELEDENDVILPSPNKNKKLSQSKKYARKANKTGDVGETLFMPAVTSTCCTPAESITNRKQTNIEIKTQDLDETLFMPPVTSTCKLVPAESSYDRIPQVSKSPPYKYRRDAVRKREERMKLPGQQCHDCALFFEAAGISKEDRQKAMNACSKHRDNHPILYNSPPGFWDPVIPESQD